MLATARSSYIYAHALPKGFWYARVVILRRIGMKDYLIGKSTNSASYIIAILSLHLALITMLAHYTC